MYLFPAGELILRSQSIFTLIGAHQNVLINAHPRSYDRELLSVGKSPRDGAGAGLCAGGQDGNGGVARWNNSRGASTSRGETERASREERQSDAGERRQTGE